MHTSSFSGLQGVSRTELFQLPFFRLQPIALICEVCGTMKDKGSGTKSKSWTCKFCTLDNGIEADRCSACGEWRYSYGPPTSTRGPYLGT